MIARMSKLVCGIGASLVLGFGYTANADPLTSGQVEFVRMVGGVESGQNGSPVDSGPGHFTTTEIGGEFTWKVNSGLTAIQTVAGAHIGSDNNTGSQYFKTFCLSVNDNIGLGGVYYGQLSGSPSVAGSIDRSPSAPLGTYTLTSEMAWLFTRYNDGAAFVGTGDDAASGVQLALWALEGFGVGPTIGDRIDSFAPLMYSTAKADAKNDLDVWTNSALVGEQHDWLLAGNPNFGSVQVLNLYNDSAHAGLAQSQITFAQSGGTIPTPLPGVALMGIVSLSGLAGMKVIRRRRI